MNGGPGSTSMNALFMENGPLRVTQPSDDFDDFHITYQPELSWLPLGDIMFVDHPVGTGWSYGDKSPTSLTELSEEFVAWLLNFYKEFPARKS